MKRAALLLLLFAALAGVLPAFAGTSIISGTITGNHGFIENFDANCTPFNNGQVFYYEVYTMTVSADGAYDYVSTSADFTTWIAIYTLGGFDPATPTANCIDSNYTGTFTLAAGSYTVVVTTVPAEVTGDFAFTLTGPGDVTLVVGNAPSCAASVTADAVVGNMPFTTQADWAPGKEANGVVINPGTYWVLGEDASGQYYEIVLSCQYLWVPVGSMQPSFLPPQNGAPLPTDVVG